MTSTRKAWVYILRCSDLTYYTGWCYDICKRLKQHKEGKGSKYVRARLPFSLVHTESYETKSEAMKREAEIKKMSRTQKLELWE